MSEETVTFNLELNVEQAISEVRRLQTLLYRTISLLRRLGLPEDVNAVITRIQRLIMVVRLLHTALVSLQAATGPYGIALALVGLGTAAVTAADVVIEG